MLQEEAYIMYLRKSRMDTDFDEVSVEETLNRHKSMKITYFRDPTDPNKIEIRLYPKLGRFLDR